MAGYYLLSVKMKPENKENPKLHSKIKYKQMDLIII